MGRSERLNWTFLGTVTHTVICYQVNIAGSSILPYLGRLYKELLVDLPHLATCHLVSSLAVIHKFDYVFAENGTVQYKDGKLLSKHVSEHTESHLSCSVTMSARMHHVICLRMFLL